MFSIQIGNWPFWPRWVFAFAMAKVVEIFLFKNTTNFVDNVRFPLFVPFAAILLASLMNVRIAALQPFSYRSFMRWDLLLKRSHSWSLIY